MNDDWRLQIDLHNKGVAGEIADHLRSGEIKNELELEFADSMIVSHEGETTFVYAGTREPLEWVRDEVQKFVDSKGWQATLELRRWHPVAESWEEPDEPLPVTAAEEDAEHAERIEMEDEEAADRGGLAEFEVRVEFPSHGEAHEFAEKLEAEGFEPVRRWRYMVVGAADEDAANELAERIRNEAPADAKVTAEGSLAAAWRERPVNPFFFLGGLAG
jgi:hypothetical protein